MALAGKRSPGACMFDFQAHSKKSPLNKPFCLPCQTKNSSAKRSISSTWEMIDVWVAGQLKSQKKTASWQQFQKEKELLPT